MCSKFTQIGKQCLRNFPTTVCRLNSWDTRSLGHATVQKFNTFELRPKSEGDCVRAERHFSTASQQLQQINDERKQEFFSESDSVKGFSVTRAPIDTSFNRVLYDENVRTFGRRPQPPSFVEQQRTEEINSGFAKMVKKVPKSVKVSEPSSDDKLVRNRPNLGRKGEVAMLQQKVKASLYNGSEKEESNFMHLLAIRRKTQEVEGSEPNRVVRDEKSSNPPSKKSAVASLKSATRVKPQSPIKKPSTLATLKVKSKPKIQEKPKKSAVATVKSRAPSTKSSAVHSYKLVSKHSLHGVTKKPSFPVSLKSAVATVKSVTSPQKSVAVPQKSVVTSKKSTNSPRKSVSKVKSKKSVCKANTQKKASGIKLPNEMEKRNKKF